MVLLRRSSPTSGTLVLSLFFFWMAIPATKDIVFWQSWTISWAVERNGFPKKAPFVVSKYLGLVRFYSYRWSCFWSCRGNLAPNPLSGPPMSLGFLNRSVKFSFLIIFSVGFSLTRFISGFPNSVCFIVAKSLYTEFHINLILQIHHQL